MIAFFASIDQIFKKLTKGIHPFTSPSKQQLKIIENKNNVLPKEVIAILVAIGIFFGILFILGCSFIYCQYNSKCSYTEDLDNCKIEEEGGKGKTNASSKDASKVNAKSADNENTTVKLTDREIMQKTREEMRGRREAWDDFKAERKERRRIKKENLGRNRTYRRFKKFSLTKEIFRQGGKNRTMEKEAKPRTSSISHLIQQSLPKDMDQRQTTTLRNKNIGNLMLEVKDREAIILREELSLKNECEPSMSVKSEKLLLDNPDFSTNEIMASETNKNSSKNDSSWSKLRAKRSEAVLIEKEQQAAAIEAPISMENNKVSAPTKVSLLSNRRSGNDLWFKMKERKSDIAKMSEALPNKKFYDLLDTLQKQGEESEDDDGSDTDNDGAGGQDYEVFNYMEENDEDDYDDDLDDGGDNEVEEDMIVADYEDDLDILNDIEDYE